ncbi:MAG: hypothetical protein NZ772_18500 [Cyanobacteria bacterium]|nr:hypothetical protein [Cyanobacteriota bacterium]MDW8201875.1 hypothetical protein [Cyanobacteriota bacterium SKYGB_h_bin112]
MVTTNDVPDSEVLTDVLEAMAGDLEPVSTDRAYDYHHGYDEMAQRGAKSVISPRNDAVIWHHGNSQAPSHPRNENLCYSRQHGRKG